MRAKVIIQRTDQIKKEEKRGVCETMGEKKKACRVLMGKTEGRYHLENLSVYWRIILKRIFKK
jgi:hypothetical protein